MDFDAFNNFVEEESAEEKATLEYITQVGEEALALAEAMAELQEQIDGLNGRYRHLVEKEIPRCLQDLGMRKFSLSDGTEIKLKEFVSGTLNNAPDRQFALNWLSENGMDELFTIDVGVKFPKGGHNEANDVRADLEARGLAVDFKEGIHPQTYQKELRLKHEEYLEKCENGEVAEPVPFVELGAYYGVKADIKAPKKKK